MITRNDVIKQAIDTCLKEMYSLAQPSTKWEEFVKMNELYHKQYIEWENFRKANSDIQKEYEEKLGWTLDKSMEECIGPRPYEYFYLSNDIQDRIINDYVYAYEFDNQQDLLDIIETLKDYCKKPLIDKWIEGEEGLGHRGYDSPDNLKKEIQKLIQEYDSSDVSKEISEKCCNKFFEFLDMAGNFYNWNRDSNAFRFSVNNISPNTNKERVIENWKKYKNKEIEIKEIEYED